MDCENEDHRLLHGKVRDVLLLLLKLKIKENLFSGRIRKHAITYWKRSTKIHAVLDIRPLMLAFK